MVELVRPKPEKPSPGNYAYMFRPLTLILPRRLHSRFPGTKNKRSPVLRVAPIPPCPIDADEVKLLVWLQWRLGS